MLHLRTLTILMFRIFCSLKVENNKVPFSFRVCSCVTGKTSFDDEIDTIITPQNDTNAKNFKILSLGYRTIFLFIILPNTEYKILWLVYWSASELTVLNPNHVKANQYISLKLYLHSIVKHIYLINGRISTSVWQYIL